MWSSLVHCNYWIMLTNGISNIQKIFNFTCSQIVLKCDVFKGWGGGGGGGIIDLKEDSDGSYFDSTMFFWKLFSLLWFPIWLSESHTEHLLGLIRCVLLDLIFSVFSLRLRLLPVEENVDIAATVFRIDPVAAVPMSFFSFTFFKYLTTFSASSGT